MDELAAHVAQHRLGRRHVLLVLADHEGQRGVGGADRPAGHGRVQGPVPGGARLLRGGARVRDVDGGAVDEERAGLRGGQEPLGTAVRGEDVATRRQHGDDDVRVPHRLGSGVRDPDPAVAGRGVGRVREVEAHHVMAGGGQVDGHRTAHVAQADEADPLLVWGFGHRGPPVETGRGRDSSRSPSDAK